MAGRRLTVKEGGPATSSRKAVATAAAGYTDGSFSLPAC